MQHHYTLGLEVLIKFADESLLNDLAFWELKEGVGDRNETTLSDDDFTKLVVSGKVVIATLKDDPIAYAVVENKSIKEMYIEYGFRDSDLESAFKDFVEKT